MIHPTRSGLREIQIARGVVTLRWVAIPVFFSFALIATNLLHMKFQLLPIYVICCLIALMNIFFTFHISFLSRQLFLRRGQAALRKFTMRLLSALADMFHSRGTRAFLDLPGLVVKLGSAIYLMVIDSLKTLRFNPLSLTNILHTQIVFDILMILLFVRYTGTAESPMIMLIPIPILVSSAVMGLYRGGLYAVSSSVMYLGLCLLVYLRVISPIKFYGPEYGDLGGSLGWIISIFTVVLVSLSGVAYLSHSLTSALKERIYFLNQLLDVSRREGFTGISLAQNSTSAWILVDAQMIVHSSHKGRLEVLPDLPCGSKLTEVIPQLQQYGLSYLVQAMVSGARFRELEKAKLVSSEGLTHIVSVRLYPLKNSPDSCLVLLILDDQTEKLFLREREASLKQSLEEAHQNLGKVTLNYRETNQKFKDSLKLSYDRSVEIEMLTQQLSEAKGLNFKAEERLSSLMSELAATRSGRDSLSAELGYKTMLLGEIHELLGLSGNLSSLAEAFETRFKTIFKLDGVWLQTFDASTEEQRFNEVIESRKLPPRVSETLKSNMRHVENSLIARQPVLIKTDLKMESSTDNGKKNSLNRWLVVIPIKHLDSLIGVLFVESFDQSEEPESIIGRITDFVRQNAPALNIAVREKFYNEGIASLNEEIRKLETSIESFQELIRLTHKESKVSFERFLKTLCRMTGAVDGSVVRINFDGELHLHAKIEPSRPDTLNQIEEKLVRKIMEVPGQKAVLHDKKEGFVLIGYPLNQSGKLCGVMMLKIPDNAVDASPIMDASAILAEKHLSIIVFNEEKELWESFYKQNLSA